jgi:hypothetical protein
MFDAKAAHGQYHSSREEVHMRSRTSSLLIAAGALVSVLLGAPAVGGGTGPDATDDQPAVSEAGRQQLILWTSGDREVALKMVFMYTYNAKKRGWMDTVRLLVWGPSAKLLSEDEELQKQLAGLKEVGVELYACKACADMYGVSEKLTTLGVDVQYSGTMLAELQQQGWHVLTI